MLSFPVAAGKKLTHPAWRCPRLSLTQLRHARDRALNGANRRGFPDLCAAALWAAARRNRRRGQSPSDPTVHPRTAGGVLPAVHNDSAGAWSQMLINPVEATNGNQDCLTRWKSPTMQQNGDAECLGPGHSGQPFSNRPVSQQLVTAGLACELNAFLGSRHCTASFLYCDPDTGTVNCCTSSQSEPQK